jgi:hypothetical protein
MKVNGGGITASIIYFVEFLRENVDIINSCIIFFAFEPEV